MLIVIQDRIKNFLKKWLPATRPGQKARKQLLAIKLGKNDIAIDCGANVGTISQYLARSRAIVYCFEPNPYAFEVLQRRFSRRHNVHCIDKGVGDENARMKLYLHHNSDQNAVYWSTGSSCLKFKSNVLDKYVEVEIIDLCQFIEGLNSKVRVLKMDVEGLECKILTKLINTGLIDKIDHVFIETHDHKIPELKDETNQIRELIAQEKLSNISLDWT